MPPSEEEQYDAVESVLGCDGAERAKPAALLQLGQWIFLGDAGAHVSALLAWVRAALAWDALVARGATVDEPLRRLWHPLCGAPRSGLDISYCLWRRVGSVPLSGLQPWNSTSMIDARANSSSDALHLAEALWNLAVNVSTLEWCHPGTIGRVALGDGLLRGAERWFKEASNNHTHTQWLGAVGRVRVLWAQGRWTFAAEELDRNPPPEPPGPPQSVDEEREWWDAASDLITIGSLLQVSSAAFLPEPPAVLSLICPDGSARAAAIGSPAWLSRCLPRIWLLVAAFESEQLWPAAEAAWRGLQAVIPDGAPKEVREWFRCRANRAHRYVLSPDAPEWIEASDSAESDVVHQLVPGCGSAMDDGPFVKQPDDQPQHSRWTDLLMRHSPLLSSTASLPPPMLFLSGPLTTSFTLPWPSVLQSIAPEQFENQSWWLLAGPAGTSGSGSPQEDAWTTWVCHGQELQSPLPSWAHVLLNSSLEQVQPPVTTQNKEEQEEKRVGEARRGAGRSIRDSESPIPSHCTIAVASQVPCSWKALVESFTSSQAGSSGCHPSQLSVGWLHVANRLRASKADTDKSGGAQRCSRMAAAAAAVSFHGNPGGVQAQQAALASTAWFALMDTSVANLRLERPEASGNSVKWLEVAKMAAQAAAWINPNEETQQHQRAGIAIADALARITDASRVNVQSCWWCVETVFADAPASMWPFLAPRNDSYFPQSADPLPWLLVWSSIHPTLWDAKARAAALSLPRSSAPGSSNADAPRAPSNGTMMLSASETRQWLLESADARPFAVAWGHLASCASALLPTACELQDDCLDSPRSLFRRSSERVAQLQQASSLALTAHGQAGAAPCPPVVPAAWEAGSNGTAGWHWAGPMWWHPQCSIGIGPDGHLCYIVSTQVHESVQFASTEPRPSHPSLWPASWWWYRVDGGAGVSPAAAMVLLRFDWSRYEARRGAELERQAWEESSHQTEASQATTRDWGVSLAAEEASESRTHATLLALSAANDFPALLESQQSRMVSAEWTNPGPLLHFIDAIWPKTASWIVAPTGRFVPRPSGAMEAHRSRREALAGLRLLVTHFPHVREGYAWRADAWWTEWIEASDHDDVHEPTMPQQKARRSASEAAARFLPGVSLLEGAVAGVSGSWRNGVPIFAEMLLSTSVTKGSPPARDRNATDTPPSFLDAERSDEAKNSASVEELMECNLVHSSVRRLHRLGLAYLAVGSFAHASDAWKEAARIAPRSCDDDDDNGRTVSYDDGQPMQFNLLDGLWSDSDVARICGVPLDAVMPSEESSTSAMADIPTFLDAHRHLADHSGQALHRARTSAQMALRFASQGQPSSVDSALEDVETFAPPVCQPWALLRRGDAETSLGRKKAAAERFTQAAGLTLVGKDLRASQQFPEPRLALARWLRLEGRPSGALKVLEGLAETSSDDGWGNQAEEERGGSSRRRGITAVSVPWPAQYRRSEDAHVVQASHAREKSPCDRRLQRTILLHRASAVAAMRTGASDQQATALLQRALQLDDTHPVTQVALADLLSAGTGVGFHLGLAGGVSARTLVGVPPRGASQRGGMERAMRHYSVALGAIEAHGTTDGDWPDDTCACAVCEGIGTGWRKARQVWESALENIRMKRKREVMAEPMGREWTAEDEERSAAASPSPEGRDVSASWASGLVGTFEEALMESAAGMCANPSVRMRGAAAGGSQFDEFFQWGEEASQSAQTPSGMLLGDSNGRSLTADLPWSLGTHAALRLGWLRLAGRNTEGACDAFESAQEFASSHDDSLASTLASIGSTLCRMPRMSRTTAESQLELLLRRLPRGAPPLTASHAGTVPGKKPAEAASDASNSDVDDLFAGSNVERLPSGATRRTQQGGPSVREGRAAGLRWSHTGVGGESSSSLSPLAPWKWTLYQQLAVLLHRYGFSRLAKTVLDQRPA